VTTIDTIRYSYLQEFFITHEIQSLFVGPTGTGKSAYIQNVLLNKLNREKFITIDVGFSPRLTPTR
jgi:dynein heavy chain